MAVTYDNVAFGRIEEALKQYIDDEFQNVYISPKFVDRGNEFIRINLESSTNIMTTGNFEQREYIVMIRYYLDDANQTDMNTNEAIKNKIDRLKKKLLDSSTFIRTSLLHSARWDELNVDSIEYNIQDEENEEDENLYIAELMCSIQSTYTFD